MTVVAEFTVPGEPVPKARARTTKTGHTFTPERTVAAERAITTAWLRAGLTHRPVADDRYWVTLTFYRASKGRCDLDNLAKTVLDALNGLAWCDDSQVSSLWLEKLPAAGGGPLTVVRVELVPSSEVAA